MNLGDALRKAGALGRRSRVVVTDGFVFEGGLNLVDPPLTVRPGQLLGCKNYEPGVRGGYDRVEGYERFDGRPSPTRADYWAIQIDGVTGSPFVVGHRLRQYNIGETTFNASTQHADGIIASINNVGGGSWVLGLVQTADTTEFQSGFIQDGDVYTSTVATGHPGTFRGVSSFAFLNGAPNDTVNEQIIFDKTEFYRADIKKVGDGLCAGKVLGVSVFKDRVVAWRNNIAGTAALMFETDQNAFTGWQQVNLGFKVYFDQGGPEITVGTTFIGAVSGAVAICRRVVSDDGSYNSLDASGFIVTDLITGTFTLNEELRVLGVKRARYKSTVTQALAPNGRYRTRVHNFAGAGDKTSLYGVNGENKAFEYDGSVFAMIDTGMVDDRPTHIFVLNNHLGLCFRGGSIQTSGFQLPLNWNPIVGADERSIGGTVTNVSEETNRTVFIASRDRTWVYYGDVVENFQLREFSNTTGMLPDTAAEVGHTIFLDDQGFSTLKAVQDFGNFSTNSISDKIKPLVNTLIEGQQLAGAVVSRRKNLYRMFFSDGTGLAINSRSGSKLSGWTVVNYLANPSCFDSGELEYPVGIIPGQTLEPGPIRPERVFMGAEDGFVYEMDIGNSFDGNNIEHFIRLVYHHTRSPERFKHYRKATIDVDVRSVTTLFATVDFNYGVRTGQAGIEIEFQGGGGLWDIANWDEFKWSGSVFDQVSLKIEGDGFNIGLFFYGNSNRETYHTIYNTTYHYSPRKINRGSQSG